MMYTVILTESGLPDTPLTQWEADMDFDRLFVNALFDYKDKSYRVYKCIPASNPPASNVTYYVTEDNPDSPYKQDLIEPSYYKISETQKLII